MAEGRNEASNRAAGYIALIERFELDVMPHWHCSRISDRTTHRIEHRAGQVHEFYPSNYWPGEKLGSQLEFAMKYDGINMAILAGVFRAMNVTEFVGYIRSKPTGKYTRRLWFLYEFITRIQLPLEDLDRGPYIDLLDPSDYYTTTPRRVKRQRINNNLLGESGFCPTVRRTEALAKFDESAMRERCRQLIAQYPAHLVERALSYLYTKETRSSFEIEHITPTANYMARFVSLLKSAEQEDFCEKSRLVELQNKTVEPRFQNSDYRVTQVYVGQTIGPSRQKVHCVFPKPADLPELMDEARGLPMANRRMESGNTPPLIRAAVVAYGFVFLHPFDDGNGRIHRFLIHNILARAGFTPAGFIFPISATMLKTPKAYDASLEAFSNPLMEIVQYTLDENGEMLVQNDTLDWYRFIDMTPQAEAMCFFIERTIEVELIEEFEFLTFYDRAKSTIRNIVDMPDRLIDLFIRFCEQNNGRLSATKRQSHFDKLTDDEVARIEHAIAEAHKEAASRKPATN